MKETIRRLLREVPFRPFALVLDSGHHIVIEHPENLVPGENQTGQLFSAIFHGRRYLVQWASVSFVFKEDTGESLLGLGPGLD